MTPYNICENKWVSNTKKRVEQHYNKNQTLYIFFLQVCFLSLQLLWVLLQHLVVFIKYKQWPHQVAIDNPPKL